MNCIRPWHLSEARANAGFLLDPEAGTSHEVWFRRDDWKLGGEQDDGAILQAAGEARARALDPWAASRSRGEACPPLLDWADSWAKRHAAAEASPVAKSNAPLSDTVSNRARKSNTAAKSNAEQSNAPFDKAAYQREYMRKRREARAAGQGEAKRKRRASR